MPHQRGRKAGSIKRVSFAFLSRLPNLRFVLTIAQRRVFELLLQLRGLLQLERSPDLRLLEHGGNQPGPDISRPE